MQHLTQESQREWDDAIREHDRKVFLSLLGLGLCPDDAREVAQSAWAKLIESHAQGSLPRRQLPGLAIRQARFLGLNELKRRHAGKRILAAVPSPE